MSMKHWFITSLIIFSFSAAAQQDPKALQGLMPVMAVLAPEQSEFKNFKMPAEENCDDEVEAKSVEIANKILSRVKATGSIYPVPGTDKSKVTGILMVVDEPGTVKDLEALRSQTLNKDITYTVIDPNEGTATKVSVHGAGLRLRGDLQNEGRSRITFTAEVEASKGGQVRAGIRIIR